MNSRLRMSSIIIVITLVLALGLTGGVFLDRQAFISPDPTIPPNAKQNFGLMAEAWNTIQKYYVDRSAVQSKNLTYGAISGMVNALGDTGHSTFLSPDMVKQEQNYTQGEFDGIGAEVQMKNGHVVIVAPFDGSPAQKAGLRPGDIILKVNGKDATGLSLEEVVSQIIGPAGTKVTLNIENPKSGQTRDVTITRARIEIHNVTWHMIPGTTIADVRIAGFSEGVTNDLKTALDQAKQQGATGLVLDLRNNPGGLLNQAIGVASQFLTSGNVLLEKNAKGDIKQVPVESGAVAPKIPMVVLINTGTASASEIVSGALQDYNRATLIGETTFGTGTVLDEFPLSDGSALLLATEEWLTPKGRTIWHKGITPNTVVSMSTDILPVFPDAMQGMTPAQLKSSGDVQLLRALEVLSQPGKNSTGQNNNTNLLPTFPNTLPAGISEPVPNTAKVLAQQVDGVFDGTSTVNIYLKYHRDII